MPLDLACFRAVFPERLMLENEPMKNYTSFRAGGPADLILVPDSIELLKRAIDICAANNLDYYIIGNCSNLLVRDAGFRGVLIKIGQHLSDVSFKDGGEPSTIIVTAQAGVLLGDLSRLACDRGLTGLEFASGIPGTLGGAVCMNAGAYDSEVKDVLQEAEILTPEGRTVKLLNADMEFGYRTSMIQSSKSIVLSAGLLLKRGDKNNIKNRVDELTISRSQKQPLEQPSAGSTFKRPVGHYAGKLITDAGLKGYSIGGAKVSEKHAGFIVNYNNASAADITELIDHVIFTVKQKFGVALEPEVKIIGDA